MSNMLSNIYSSDNMSDINMQLSTYKKSHLYSKSRKQTLRNILYNTSINYPHSSVMLFFRISSFSSSNICLTNNFFE